MSATGHCVVFDRNGVSLHFRFIPKTDVSATLLVCCPDRGLGGPCVRRDCWGVQVEMLNQPGGHALDARAKSLDQKLRFELQTAQFELTPS